MKTLFLATAAVLAFSAAPASAQILGGNGGLGGALGGGGSLDGLGGTIGGSGAGTLGSALERVREPATTTTRTDGSARAGSHVDRRSGRVGADGSAATDVSTMLDGTPGATGLDGNGTASGSASGSATADLIGTDDVRSVAGSAANTVRGAAGRTRELAAGTRDSATSAVGGLGGATGSASGGGSAGGTADGAIGNGVLALDGTAAANALGSFAVAPGMNVTDLKGRTIGTVRNVVTDARGRVQAVRMEIGRRTATVPAANFSGSGDVLVSAASKGEIREIAEDQPGG
ncbi:hypothetical protein ACMGDH_15580 [Sphingomonas sp. DT-207]|uniref:hypothetical protein n=1 Tax=Sphingomonas sp. DT-207 TaxID=3396167 RepID=UPI003F1B285F